MSRLILWILLTLGAIALEYFRRREPKRSLIALGIFAWILSLAVAGMTMRAVLPFFLAHILLILFAWGALLYSLYARRWLWWAFLLPLLTPALFFLFGLLEGSRFER
jgi:ABC-type Fe3+ transport system permease subunit